MICQRPLESSLTRGGHLWGHPGKLMPPLNSTLKGESQTGMWQVPASLAAPS